MTFKNRVVRDLAWVIGSPPLVSGLYQQTQWWRHEDCQAELKACLAALHELDKDPEPLQLRLEQLKSRRLGSRFEAFIAYWLELSPNYQLLAQNIQIIEDGLTHGEIDFIIRDLHTNKTIHLEVAVKFYLGAPPLDNAFQWYGTNTKDQLGKKFEHLHQRQTQLSKRFETYLDHTIDERHCILKGRLFYPDQTNTTAPALVDEDHQRGIWLMSDDFYPVSSQLIKLDKKHWLAELEHVDCEMMTKLSGFEDRHYPQCYAAIVKTDEENWKETHRIFRLPKNFTFPTAD